MPAIPTTEIEDSVPKINDEVAVGEDLKFQHRWWRFERAIWVFFAILVLLDVLGVFGRGWASQAEVRTNDGTMDVHYERVERFSSPSILNIEFGPNAIHDGKLQLWVNEGMIKQLGTQRVVPQPRESIVGDDGITYTFDATHPPASVQFGLQPSGPGVFPLELRVPGAQMITVRVVVMP